MANPWAFRDFSVLDISDARYRAREGGGLANPRVGSSHCIGDGTLPARGSARSAKKKDRAQNRNGATRELETARVYAWITRQFLSRIGLSHRPHDTCDPCLSLRKNATWYGLGQPASWRSSNTWMSFSSRLGNRLRKATTTSGVGSLMQARLHLRPSQEHFSELVSACAAPVAKNNAATPAWNNFFMVISLKDAIVSNHRGPRFIGRRPRLRRKGRAQPTG